jgi:hypothetical protein
MRLIFFIAYIDRLLIFAYLKIRYARMRRSNYIIIPEFRTPFRISAYTVITFRYIAISQRSAI